MIRNLLAAVLIAAFGSILLLSDRDWFLSDQYRAVADLAPVPEGRGPILSSIKPLVLANGVHVVLRASKAEALYPFFAATGRLPAVARDRAFGPVRYGVSIREISFLGMPFGWFREFGPVVYTRSTDELVQLPLLPAAEEQLRGETGRDLAAGSIFPFWAHCWGWLFVAGLALWGWLRHRWVVETRAALGII